MLLIVACLLPLAACAPSAEPSSKNYVLDIGDGVLKNVRFDGEPSPRLNLSGMGLRALEKNAFDDVPDLESLDVSNNSLESLPEFVFSNLTRLRTLSLSDNRISSLSNLFLGLENLRLLDVSRNPIRHLRKGDLFGLHKSARILTDGNIFWSISTDVSANAFLKNGESEQLNNKETSAEDDEGNKEEEEEEEEDNEKHESERKVESKIGKDTRVQLCKSEGSDVTSLELLGKDEFLAEGCAQVPIDAAEKTVNLREQGIAGFQEGWYRLRPLPIASLDLSNNEIAEVREETLNDLPAGLTYVNLSGNKIRRLWSGMIANVHLRTLNFKDNLIEEIEGGAFEGTRKLRGLSLIGNRLESLNFVSTLPSTLTSLVLGSNRVTAVPDGGAFNGLSRLRYLNLDGNAIEKLPNEGFRGLGTLQALSLKGNRVSSIEPAAFRGLTALKVLDLGRNSLRDLRNVTFAEMTALEELDLSSNKIAEAAFADLLPRSLKSLQLDRNEIDTLGRGSFARAPRTTLSLAENRISSVAPGAFELPALRDLNLNNNTLTNVDGDSYAGLGQLRRLWLSGNNISEIREGSCRNLGSLYILDVSRNPFQKLESGAFHGLNTAPGSSLYIYENNLKEMQACLFEDV